MGSLLKSTFPVFSRNPNFITPKPLRSFRLSAVVKPPPPGFDFRSEILSESRATIARNFPELLDLADNGTLVLIEKRQFGPVPAWRTEFIEPETIWLVGTTHLSKSSADDVDRVVRAVQPDNVVVELCRSRQALLSFSIFFFSFSLHF